MRKSRRVAVVVSLFSVIFVVKHFLDQSLNEPIYSDLNFKSKGSKVHILFWTTTHKYKWWASASQCRVYDNCVITRDRRFLNVSQAVVFYATQINMSDLPPQSSHATNLWVLFNLQTQSRVRRKHIFQLIDCGVNLTMSYRRDSDLYAPYGTIVAKRGKHKGVTYSQFKRKTRSIAWFASRCQTHGRREELVRELSQYIDIDIYGKCGNYSCGHRNIREDLCYQMVAKKYKFYLSFENSICPDYVSEKLFNVLKHDVVPVVFGGIDYDSLLPKKSHINALKYKSAKELASLLNYLSRDYVSYNSYFAWKQHFAPQSSWCEPFYRLCRRIQRNESPLASHTSNNARRLKAWWTRGSACTKWTRPGSRHNKR